jgi:hypothetical protein
LRSALRARATRRSSFEIVGYDNIQFTKAPHVLRGMGLTHLAKNEHAKQELAEKGMAVEQGRCTTTNWWWINLF